MQGLPGMGRGSQAFCRPSRNRLARLVWCGMVLWVLRRGTGCRRDWAADVDGLAWLRWRVGAARRDHWATATDAGNIAQKEEVAGSCWRALRLWRGVASHGIAWASESHAWLCPSRPVSGTRSRHYHRVLFFIDRPGWVGVAEGGGSSRAGAQGRAKQKGMACDGGRMTLMIRMDGWRGGGRTMAWMGEGASKASQKGPGRAGLNQARGGRHQWTTPASLAR